MVDLLCPLIREKICKKTTVQSPSLLSSLVHENMFKRSKIATVSPNALKNPIHRVAVKGLNRFR